MSGETFSAPYLASAVQLSFSNDTTKKPQTLFWKKKDFERKVESRKVPTPPPLLAAAGDTEIGYLSLHLGEGRTEETRMRLFFLPPFSFSFGSPCEKVSPSRAYEKGRKEKGKSQIRTKKKSNYLFPLLPLSPSFSTPRLKEKERGEDPLLFPPFILRAVSFFPWFDKRPPS